ncbi:MAG: hypothetical protein LUF85_16115 [Bacteroides sp.]|nr:hypothetical protein [Bacteroides sp.]
MKKLFIAFLAAFCLLGTHVQAQIVSIPPPLGFPVVLDLNLEVNQGPDFVFNLLDFVDDSTAGLITQVYILLEATGLMDLVFPIEVKSLDGPYVVLDAEAGSKGFTLSGVIPDYNIGEGRRSYLVSTTLVDNDILEYKLLTLNITLSWGVDN